MLSVGKLYFPLKDIPFQRIPHGGNERNGKASDLVSGKVFRVTIWLIY